MHLPVNPSEWTIDALVCAPHIVLEAVAPRMSEAVGGMVTDLMSTANPARRRHIARSIIEAVQAEGAESHP
jgi:uncharacterized protein YejL (UPF0352 family)